MEFFLQTGGHGEKKKEKRKMPCDLEQLRHFGDDSRDVSFYRCKMRINHRFARFYKKFTGKSLRWGKFWMHPLSMAVAGDVAQIKAIEEEYQTILQQAKNQGISVSAFPTTLFSVGQVQGYNWDSNMPFPNYLLLCAASNSAASNNSTSNIMPEGNTDRLLEIFKYLLSIDERLVNMCHRDGSFFWNHYLSVLDLVREMGTNYQPLYDFLLKSGARCTSIEKPRLETCKGPGRRSLLLPSASDSLEERQYLLRSGFSFLGPTRTC